MSRRKRQSLVSLSVFLAFVMVFSTLTTQLLALQEDASSTVILENNFAQNLGDMEDWGGTEIIQEDGNHILRLTDDGGAGLYIENYSGPRTLTLRAKGKVGPLEQVEPALVQIKMFAADSSEIVESRISLEFLEKEFTEKSVSFTIPDNAVDIMPMFYKNPGADAAYLDYVILSDNPDALVSPEESGTPTDPTDSDTTTEPENPINENPVDIFSEENIISNPNFEEEFNNNGASDTAFITAWPNDLDLDSGNIGQTKISPDGYEGNAIMTGPGEGGRSQMISNVPENVKLILKAVAKVSQDGEVGYIGVDCLDVNGKKIAGGKFGAEFFTTEWVERATEFVTVPGTSALQVYTYKNASPSGQESFALFDNFSLTVSPDFVLSEELLNNPGFEEDYAYWEDWGNTSIVTEPVVSGIKALEVQDNGGTAQYPQLENGKSYSLKVSGKVDTEGDVVYFGVDGFDANGVKKRLIGGEFTGTKFTEAELLFTVPENTVSYQVYTWKDPTGGKAYFDDFSLKIAAPKIEEEPDDTNFINPFTTDGVFFDDFENGINADYWLIGKTQWGGDGVNGGVIPENISVENGIVKISAKGDLYEGDIKGVKRVDGKIVRAEDGKRSGGVIVNKDFYASGSYEVRAKIINELGVVNAFWTYFNNGKRNDEIDWETPGVGANGMAPNQVMANTWVDELVPNSFVIDTPAIIGNEQGVTDGEWHTYRFDWHTDTADPRVEFYLDDVLVHIAREKIPTAAGRFWLGNWFPRNWAGVADFEEGTMEIDWVKITPFNEDGDEWLRGYDGDWADLSEYPNPQVDRNRTKYNTNNFAYLHVGEMADRLELTDENMQKHLQVFEDLAVNMQFLDMGYYNPEGKLPQSELDDELVRTWIAASRKYAPNHKIMATINGNLFEHLQHSAEMRQTLAEEAARLYEEYGFDGIQVDFEPFRKDSNDVLVDFLQRLRKLVPEAHISIATTALEEYLPHENIVEIANHVDMINPMLYDASGPGVNEIDSQEEFVEFWRENVLRYSKAIKDSNNPDVQLAPTMPVYEAKGYNSVPGWPNPDVNLHYYHVPEYENILAAAKGLHLAIADGADVYGSGIFWWGALTSAEYDQRDGQDYAKDRVWWMNEWVFKETVSKDEPIVIRMNELTDEEAPSGYEKIVFNPTELAYLSYNPSFDAGVAIAFYIKSASTWGEALQSDAGLSNLAVNVIDPRYEFVGWDNPLFMENELVTSRTFLALFKELSESSETSSNTSTRSEESELSEVSSEKTLESEKVSDKSDLSKTGETPVFMMFTIIILTAGVLLLIGRMRYVRD